MPNSVISHKPTATVTSMKLIRNPDIALIFTMIIWLLSIGVGVTLVMKFDNTSGTSGISPSGWPADSQIARNRQLPTLVMMVHPHCPCSRASINELAILMTLEAGRVNAEVVFVKPTGSPEKWEQTDLWQSAAIIPGVQLRVDDGTEARRFGSLTSGKVMFYSASGQLLFSGGITSSRGQEGDNDGRSSIRSILAKGSTDVSTTPVFGCALFNRVSSNQIKDARYVNQDK